jgi:hypothetical protein
MHPDGLAVTKLDPDATLTADARRTRRQVPVLAAVPPADCGKLDRFHETLKQHLHAQPPASTIAELQHQLDDAIAHHTGLLARMQDFACARPLSPAHLRRFVGETGYAGGPFSPTKREARGTLFRSGGTRRRKCGSAHDVLNADRIRRRKPYR